MFVHLCVCLSAADFCHLAAIFLAQLIMAADFRHFHHFCSCFLHVEHEARVEREVLVVEDTDRNTFTQQTDRQTHAQPFVVIPSQQCGKYVNFEPE